MYLRIIALVLLTSWVPSAECYDFMDHLRDNIGDKIYYKMPVFSQQKTVVVHPNDSRTPWKDLSTYWATGWRMLIGHEYIGYKCYNIKQINVRDAIVPGGAGTFTLTMSPFDFVGQSKTWTIPLGVRDADYSLEPFNLGCHYGRVQLQAEFSPTDYSTKGPAHRGECDGGYCGSAIIVGLKVDLAGWADKYITFVHYYDGYDLYPSAVRWSPDIISMTRADEWVTTKLEFGYDSNVAVDDGTPTTTCTFNAVGDACSMIEARTSWGSNAVFPISDIPDLDVQWGDPVRQLYLRGVKGKVGSGVCGLNATLTYR